MFPKGAFFLLFIAIFSGPCFSQQIDREALFRRHSPHFQKAHPLNALTVGNGAFAFTTDATGLQTFTEYYAENGLPLSTLSEWGWHSFPNVSGFKIEDTYQDFDTYGRPVPYPFRQQTEAGQWLRGNPHRLGLGTIGLEIKKADGSPIELSDLEQCDQRLDLWTGTLTSKFEVEGTPVVVTTLCDPDSDRIAVRIESDLIDRKRLNATLRFAYGTSDWGIVPEDWDHPESHSSDLTAATKTIRRTVDGTLYSVFVDGSVSVAASEKHEFAINPESAGSGILEFSVLFSEGHKTRRSSDSLFEEIEERCLKYWPDYWNSGGAVDLSESEDPRAHELERRIVLSQYLTAIQCRGKLPPQETGLTFNSWYGKPHLEMHWWHAVHFPLWGRVETLETMMPWYQKILPEAKGIATTQGYDGARWPKNVDTEGNQVPSSIAPLLIWQQPHPIYFAELIYRQYPNPDTLEKYREIVEATAAFMADFAHYDAESQVFDLGPPLIPAQESYDPTTTKNPPFELAYWRWGLEIAQKWRVRLGQSRSDDWDNVINELAPYPEYQDKYATAEGVWNTRDHPSVLGALGVLSGSGINRERMRNTLHEVLDTWPWEHTWGWDYPMIAMTAARLGEPDKAIESLVLDVPKNTYLANGHNFQTQDRLRIYLPGNGGLLTAIAMMAAGWDGAPEVHAPGFPQDGTWTIKWENLHPMP